jgi:hypothetical protein
MASARMAPTASARDDDRTRVATRQAMPVAPEDAGSSDDHVTEVKHSLGFILNLASASTLETEPSKDAMGFSTATMDAHQQAAHADSSSGTDSSTGKAAGKSNSKPKRTKKVGKAKAAMSHAEKRLARKCSVEDCMNYTINKGLCFRHGVRHAAGIHHWWTQLRRNFIGIITGRQAVYDGRVQGQRQDRRPLLEARYDS